MGITSFINSKFRVLWIKISEFPKILLRVALQSTCFQMKLRNFVYYLEELLSSNTMHLQVSISIVLKFMVLNNIKVCASGGKYGAKEPMEQLVSNLQNFQRFLFGEDLERPELHALFNSKQYEAVSRNICGKDHPFYKRVQVNLILMLPGN